MSTQQVVSNAQVLQVPNEYDSHGSDLLSPPLDSAAGMSDELSRPALGMLAVNLGLLAWPGRLVKTRATCLGASKDEQVF